MLLWITGLISVISLAMFGYLAEHPVNKARSELPADLFVQHNAHNMIDIWPQDFSYPNLESYLNQEIGSNPEVPLYFIKGNLPNEKEIPVETKEEAL